MKKLPELRLAFSDFWPSFCIYDNYFTHLLQTRFSLKIEQDIHKADFLIYSCFGKTHHSFKGIKIFYTGENRWPNYSECDYAFTFIKEEDDLNTRLPYYIVAGEHLFVPKENQKILPKTAFCNFIYSNEDCKLRNRFFHKLSEFKRVDSGGRVLNNMGHRVGNKLEFISRYKFTIAFENTASRGYVTEKILEPLLAGSIPIYWGDPEVETEFNPCAFIHYRNFSSEKELIDWVMEVDRSDFLYSEYVKEPIFTHPDTVGIYNRKVLDKLTDIISHQQMVRKPSRKYFYLCKKAFFGKKVAAFTGN